MELLIRWVQEPCSKGTHSVCIVARPQVLTSMGAGMDAMVLEKRARQDDNGAQPGRPELASIIRTVNAVLDENEY